MTTLTFDPFEEFRQYLAGISFKPLLADPDYSAVSKRLHKRALALLVVERQFGIELRQNPTELSASAVPYLEEFRSDVLSSLIIFHIGLYKAALMSARSAIENLFRVIAGSQELDYRKINTVFELVDLVKQSPPFKSSAIFKNSLTSVIEKYGEYCDYVHSNGEEYLSLDRKLADLPRWDKDSGTACADSLMKMLQTAICLLLMLRTSTLIHLRHDQKDLVLDALPMKMKAGLSQEIPI